MLYGSGDEPNGGISAVRRARSSNGESPELLRAWSSATGSSVPGGPKVGSVCTPTRTRPASCARRRSSRRACPRPRRPAARSAPRGRRKQEEAPATEGLATELAEALDRFDEDGANRTLDRLLAALSLETVMQQVLLPYLHVLGNRWASGEISVAQEHFASSLIRGRLLGLARGWGAGRAQALLLACPPGEEHDLGLIMFGIAAWRRGWRIVYLGQDTPIETIAQAVDAVDPALVVLAVAEGRRSRATRTRSGCWPAASRWPWVAASGPRSSRGSGSGCSRATRSRPPARSRADLR